MTGISMSATAAGRVMGARLAGADGPFRGVSIDSRRLDAGNLFAALRGERTDGLHFVGDALAAGAGAVLASQPTGAHVPQLVTADVPGALGRLAGYWRSRFQPDTVGITGSNGKTTVKEMVAAIASTAADTLATRGNLNNELGVPLTLFGLDARHVFAVVEMGANHVGEIAYLASLARPRVGVITQCAPAHLEGFGSIEGVARGKGELVESLPADGCAVLNADDAFVDAWRARSAARRVITFGLGPAADVSGDWQADAHGLQVGLELPDGNVEVSLRLLGRHNVMNALAAASAACALGLAPAHIRAGLEATRPVAGRLALCTLACGTRLIDDSYNANPASISAALDALGDFESPRWLVLGDMAELGPRSAALHREAGEQIGRRGVERLFTAGTVSREAARAFGAGAEHFDQVEPLVARLRRDIAEAAVVLVKGSRSMRMERVVADLTGER